MKGGVTKIKLTRGSWRKAKGSGRAVMVLIYICCRILIKSTNYAILKLLIKFSKSKTGLSLDFYVSLKAYKLNI